MTQPPGGRTTWVGERFSSLRLRDFRLLIIGTLVAGYGQWAQFIGLGWLIYVISGSTVQLGSISAVRGLSAIVASPISGVILDRFHRRRILIVSTLLGAAEALALAVLVFSGRVEVWHIYVFGVLDGGISTLNQITRQTFVYDVSTDETLTNAIAVSSIVQNLARVSGPPLTGAMIGWWGEGAPFAFIAIAMTGASLATLPIGRITRQGERNAGSPFRSLLDGLRAVRGDRRIIGIMVASGTPAILIYPYTQFLPVFAEEVLGRGPEAYGLLLSMMGWGSLVGLLGMAALGDLKRKGMIALTSGVIYSVLLLIFTRSTSFPLTLTLLALAGIFNAVFNALCQVLVQTLAPNEMRGRVMSVFSMTFGLFPLGALPMGIAAERYGIRDGTSMFVIAAVAILAGVSIFWGSLRRL